MGFINLQYGNTVYWDNEAYTIIAAVGLTKLKLKHVKYANVVTVPISELSSKANSDKSIDLNDYSEQEWAIAQKRLDIIKPLLGRKKTIDEIQKVASDHGVGQASVYRWISKYELNPTLSALIPNTKSRGSKKKRLPKNSNDIIQDILENYYLTKQKPSFKRTYINIEQACKHQNTAVPSKHTVLKRIQELDPMYVLKKRENTKTTIAKYGAFPGEFKNGKFPLDVYEIDHTPLDVILVDNVRRLPIGRPILTLAIDVYSRMVPGFYLSFQGPGYFNVGQCLYRCFIQKDRYLKQLNIEGEWPIYGAPRVIHVDNARELSGTEVQRICEEYGISLERRPPGQPQYGPHIERLFGTINKEIHNIPGTTFSNINEKGTYQSEKHASLTIQELEIWLTEYIVNIYHKTKHSELGTTPLQQYRFGIEEDQDNPQLGILPPLIDDDETVRISLLPTFYRTVQRTGITLDDISYYDDRLRRFVNRETIDGHKIKLKIKRDPMDISRIYVFDPNLKFYFEVPYRRMSAPAMSIWELQATKRFLAEANKTKYDEDDIFRAYYKLEEIEKKAIDSTRSLRRQNIKKTLQKKNQSHEVHEQNEPRKREFNNIVIYDIIESQKEKIP